MSSAGTELDVGQVRDRVRLYLQIMLLVDVAAYFSDALAHFGLAEAPPNLPFRYMVLRWAATGIMLAGWAAARFGRPGRVALVALESAVTLMLVLVYIQLGTAYLDSVEPSYGPGFSLLGILMLLSVRAALVPSRVWRTLGVGVAGVACWLVVSNETLDTMAPVVREGLTFMGGAVVVATAVTSRVIYGLRAQVRSAMRLGQYELGRKLGEGGMGVVYEAHHVMLRRPTAVKLLPVDRAGEETVARFEREVQQTSRLEHPNSVYIYDYGRTPEGQFYYAMEYLDGVTLDQLVARSGPLPPARAVSILRQAASALAEAHALGLIHRDVKPANIMLCSRAGIPDVVKVLDFGLVKAIDNPELTEEITQANALVGTPQYLAPESIADQHAVGPASDVYALGAIGFLLVTGRQLFPSRTVIEVCSHHLGTPPESPSAVLGSPIDADLEALIARCLAKDPADRPRDGAELAGALEALDLEGWTAEDGRAWWRDFERDAKHAVRTTGTERTQLAIDFAARR